MDNLKMLPLLAMVGSLSGCAQLGTIDPLGSTVLQERDPKREYTPDLQVHAGYICRGLTGQAGVGDINGSGIGARCQQIGKEPMGGCMKWKQPGFEFESPGCTPTPTVAPELAGRLDELMERIEAVEFANRLIREEFIEDYGPAPEK